MARLPRLVIPNQAHHILQSGNDRQAIFRDADDYAAFLAWLREAARQFKVALHAYALLPNQVHLLVSPSDDTGLSRMMQWVGRHYVPYFNLKYQRSGTLWQGRYKATVIDAEQYFLACSQYIESSPVRAGLVMIPTDYPWSSVAHHVGSRADPLITDHPLYWALGNTPFDREAAYRALLDQGLSANEVHAFDEATVKAWPLGSEKFKILLAKQTNRRVSPAKRGRPAKGRPAKETLATSAPVEDIPHTS
ncbi:MAG: transposase [Noviherbaspirillum sp.]